MKPSTARKILNTQKWIRCNFGYYVRWIFRTKEYYDTGISALLGIGFMLTVPIGALMLAITYSNSTATIPPPPALWIGWSILLCIPVGWLVIGTLLFILHGVWNTLCEAITSTQKKIEEIASRSDTWTNEQGSLSVVEKRLDSSQINRS